jgi:hypothetical protein
MSDLFFLALTLVFFAATFGLIALCSKLERKS